jgi:hypothetical protein
LNAKLLSALVEDVSRKLNSSNLLAKIESLSKQVNDMKGEIEKHKNSAHVPAGAATPSPNRSK